MTMKQDKRLYDTTAWRRLRKQALQRDNYLCQYCLKRKVFTPATEVHHIKPLIDYPELGMTLSNLTSLCWNCHEETKHQKAATITAVRIIKV